MTTMEVTKMLLLTGRHITYRDLEANTEIRSVKLAQRVHDIERKFGWKVERQTVKGKGSLMEYWLDKSEIERITGTKSKDEQLTTESENIAESQNIVPKNAQEQQSLGLFGELQ